MTDKLALKDLEHTAPRLDRLTRDRAAWAAAGRACRRHFNDQHTLDVAVSRYLWARVRVPPARVRRAALSNLVKQPDQVQAAMFCATKSAKRRGA